MGPRNDRPTVTFLCPTCVTGGPEALHQAAAAFRLAGAEVQIAYYGEGVDFERVGDTLAVGRAEINPCMTALASYEPVAAREIPLHAGALVVLPEVLAGWIDMFRPARIALWWLSVDNALASMPALRDEAARHALFERGDVEHWYQSDYAKRFLIANGARTAYRLTDYTPSDFTVLQAAGPNPGRRVLYNRRKGADLAQRFFAANPDLEPQPLDGLDRKALIAAYRGAPLYVDFGGLPGKDRMPREAVACGCIAFLHNVGAGREMGDFPVHDVFRFDDADIDGGQLAAKLRMALTNLPAVWSLQAVLRETVRQERSAFLHEADMIVRSMQPVSQEEAPERRLAIA